MADCFFSAAVDTLSRHLEVDVLPVDSVSVLARGGEDVIEFMDGIADGLRVVELLEDGGIGECG